MNIPANDAVYREFSWPIQFSNEVTAIACAGNGGLRVIVNIGWSTVGFSFMYLNTYTSPQGVRGAAIAVGY